MYPPSDTALSGAADSLGHLPTPPDASPQHYSTTPQQHQTDVSAYNYSYNSCSSGSGCSSYVGSPSSLASYETQRLMKRSLSSHSLQKNNINNGPHHPISALFADLLDSHNGPVRRVYSTGDLQIINGMQHYHQSDSPLSSESSMIIEGMNRASPYSPEEKKVRIERYRSKRNQRNFNKKIKYACRKTLADSRPRIRGRFARNDEIVMNPPVQWSHVGAGEEEDEEDENWANFFDSLDPGPANLAQEPQDSSSFGVFY